MLKIILFITHCFINKGKIPVCVGTTSYGQKKLLALSFNLGNKIYITPSPCGFNRRTNATVKTGVWVRFIVSTG